MEWSAKENLPLDAIVAVLDILKSYFRLSPSRYAAKGMKFLRIARKAN
jgi:hypothetical protein